MRLITVVFSVFLFLCSSAGIGSAEERFEVPLGNSPARGPQDAPITMIEFLDFQ